MGAVEVNISISVDGFVTGPNVGEYPGLGEGGEILHAWLEEPEGKRIIGDAFSSAGAVITSRKVYELTRGWGDDGFYKMPVFVFTRHPHDVVVKGPTTFTFVTDGIESAVAQAKAAAGTKKVHIMGGAGVVQQALNAGLVDELHLHVAPVVFGAGTRLFDNVQREFRLEPAGLFESPLATHLRYRVVK